MIWIIVTVIALLLVFVWALCRAAAMADLRAEQMFRSPRWADEPWLTYSDEPRVRVTRVPPGPYDHEARGDFDE